MSNPRYFADMNITVLCLSLCLAFGDGLAAKAFFSRSESVEPASAKLPKMTIEEIVTRLVAANAKRARDLKGFDGKRVYNLDYRGFPGHREANMVVEAHYSAPATKTFDVLAESGSKWIQNHVLQRLLDGERDSADPANQRRTALTPDNYKFTLLGTKPSRHGGCYLLRAEPLQDNKYLFRGEICVNGMDFAVESIDAEPAKNPSFWIRNTRIEHQYEKNGEFWLPALNKSVTKVRLGGTATLTIRYTDYDLRPEQRASHALN